MIDKELAGPIATVVAAFAAAIVAIAFGRAQYRIALSQARIAEAQKQIAKAQLDIAQDRLKQDFFEKRYEIYIAAKTLIEAVYKEPPVNPADPEIKKLRLNSMKHGFSFRQTRGSSAKKLMGLPTRCSLRSIYPKKGRSMYSAGRKLRSLSRSITVIWLSDLNATSALNS
jgi:hypothetical protein